ncbi:MAG: hypothetical protein AMJ54_14160 [Deltaproteobacteria bacterium SG8_13]|nr:MAG: hypothetical protein AMJ54_14160 [Deltaproteobacteria bacterium SG8_13]
MDTFDFFDIPLDGTRLIEASAGTGKTYTITGLFVRLLLEKAMSVEQILVVTYTKAATEELKTRIRGRIVEARNGFTSGSASDELIAALLEKTPDHRRAARLLTDALSDFDRATIFTIHGFCQRILHEYAFETGNLYDTELVTDPRDLQREIAEDFWRTHFYTAPAEWVTFAAQNGIRDPSYFERLAGSVHFLEATVIPRLSRPELTALDPFRRHFRQLATRWPAAREKVLEFLRSPVLDGRTYGSLSTVDPHRGVSKRDLRLDGLAAEMDRFTGSPHPGFPPFKALNKFTAGGLQAAVRRGHRPPQHDLFRICDELLDSAQVLEAEMQDLALYLKTEYFRWARAESQNRKRSRNIQHYEDLLLAVKNALTANTGGRSHLPVEKIRKNYRAALVDEFQDTDAVQYEIFSSIFGSAEYLLFIIGDPKQSIYSFRGADIFSYISAAADADSRYTLQENWRSGPGLIAAVNTLFAGRRAPFLFDAITCDPTRAGRKPEGGPQAALRSLVLWYLPSQGGQPANKTDAVAIISEAVGDEIVRLVSAAPEPTPPSDIAVLVRTNRQAQIVKESLVKRKIPAVLYSSGSVFATRESAELQRVLTGVLEHDNESRFRSALATDMIGVCGDELARADQQPSDWERRRHRFQQYAELWKRSGFIRMFRTLLVREKVRGRLLALDDGERRLTNLLHLAEVLHREADVRQLAPAALLKWLVARCRPDAPGSDEHQLRLESDERAVKIVTVHKSKGLEYPIVFCPYGWEGSRLRTGEQVSFHTAAPDRKLTVDLGSERLDSHRVLAQHEILAENLRLLYVAVTRAKKRCYLAWGRIRTAETSALAYLLHLADTAAETDILAAMAQRFASMDDDDLLTDLHALAERSKGSITIEMLPQRTEKKYRPTPARDETLVCPVFSGQIEAFWKIASFSTMTSRQFPEAGLPDHDSALQLSAPDSSEPPEATRPTSDRRSIFDFPRGARAGIFFHDLLEQLDFSPASGRERADRISKKLKEYGYDRRWQKTLLQAMDNLLQVQLPAMPAGSETFCLADVAAGHRVAEMEFYFPQQTISPESLGRIFSLHGGPDMPTGLPQHLQKLSFPPTGGFLMGYVDMLFLHENRFYLLDWKSNHLGSRREDYAPARLADIMVTEHYILQYCLYTVAANRYLQLHRPNYSYAEHFGGVFYVFIRGVDAGAGAAYGIFHDRPDPALIRALDEALIEQKT